MFSARLPRQIRSVGARFALLHTLVFVLLVAAIGTVAVISVTSALERQARERVGVEAAALVTEYDREGLAGLRSTLEARLSIPERRLRYALVDDQGKAILGDNSIASYAGADLSEGTTQGSSPSNPADLALIAVRPLTAGLFLLVADDLESIEDVEDVVTGSFLIALGLAIALGLCAGWVLSRVILRRVEAVARTAEAIGAGDLSRRIVLDKTGDEFDRLAAALNTMLDRIAALVESIGQITNDIAHDLRTPLSRLRQTLEVARARAKRLEDYERAVDHAIDEADGLLETFSALLRIAQIEASAQRFASKAVDLSEVLKTVVDAYEPVIADSGRRVRTEIEESIAVPGDRELLTQLFANFLENALHHTPVGTQIVVALVRDATGLRASVSDNGAGIPPGEREKVLQRFYRLERSRTTPGSGLGLSLAVAIADLHRARLHILENDPGVRVVVDFGEAGEVASRLGSADHLWATANASAVD